MPTEDSLFDSTTSNSGSEVITTMDGRAEIWENFIARPSALFHELHASIPWEEREIMMFGKPVPQPRLTAWFGDGDEPYTYSGLTLQPHPWSQALKEIKEKCEDIAGVKFNSMLANLYRDGNDSVSWHSDDEPELGTNPTIASISLGAERRFDLRHKLTKETIKKNLSSGSLILMSGSLQHHWIHQIAKTKRVSEPRINLTFRVIKTTA